MANIDNLSNKKIADLLEENIGHFSKEHSKQNGTPDHDLVILFKNTIKSYLDVVQNGLTGELGTDRKFVKFLRDRVR